MGMVTEDPVLHSSFYEGTQLLIWEARYPSPRLHPSPTCYQPWYDLFSHLANDRLQMVRNMVPLGLRVHDYNFHQFQALSLMLGTQKPILCPSEKQNKQTNKTPIYYGHRRVQWSSGHNMASAESEAWNGCSENTKDSQISQGVREDFPERAQLCWAQLNWWWSCPRARRGEKWLMVARYSEADSRNLIHWH